MDNIDLELLAGMPIKIQEGIYIHQFTIKEIIKEIGTSKYNQCLSLLLIDEDYIEEVLDRDDLEIPPYIFIIQNCIHNIEFQQLICNAYEVFLKCEVVFDDEYGLVFMTKDNQPVALDEGLYKNIQRILRKSNCIPEPEKYSPANEKAKEFIKKLKRNKRMAKKNIKSEFTLADIISGIKWKSGESYSNVFNLTMYQLYDGLSRLQIIDNYDNTMLGVYTGSIKVKNNDAKEINWFKSIDKN